MYAKRYIVENVSQSIQFALVSSVEQSKSVIEQTKPLFAIWQK